MVFLTAITNEIESTALATPESSGIRHTPSKFIVGTIIASPTRGNTNVYIIDITKNFPARPKAVRKPDRQPSIQFTK